MTHENIEDAQNFIGVKIALLLDDRLVVIQRDNKPGLRYAGLWDFPGGGRENGESPFACAAREIAEELAITLKPDSVIWQSVHTAMHDPGMVAIFMVAEITQADVDGIVFGDEGSGWKLISIQDFLAATDVVEPLKGRLQLFLDSGIAKSWY